MSYKGLLLVLSLLFLATAIPLSHAAIAQDGSTTGTAGQTSVGGSSITLTLTTTYTNDIIIVAVASGASGTISSVTCATGCGVTFVKRSSADGGDLIEYNGIASAALTSCTITVTLSTASAAAAVAFGVSGASLTSTFDPNVAIPSNAATGTSTVPSNAQISTTGSTDLVFGIAGIGIGIITAGGVSGLTYTTNGPLTTGNYMIGSNWGEHKIATSTYYTGIAVDNAITSTTISSGTVGITLSSSEPWYMMVDAVQQASGGTTCTFTTSNSVFQFGGAAGIAAGSSITTQNAVLITNTGSTAADIQLDGGGWSWSTPGGASVTNTVWDWQYGTAYATANQLKTAQTDTGYSLAGSGTKNLFFGLGIPATTPASSYTQSINIISSC